jgi:L-lactate permease
LVAASVACAGWEIPVPRLAAAGLAGIINALDLLLIVFEAVLILQLKKKSGGMEGISQSMASLAKDRRIQESSVKRTNDFGGVTEAGEQNPCPSSKISRA